MASIKVRTFQKVIHGIILVSFLMTSGVYPAWAQSAGNEISYDRYTYSLRDDRVTDEDARARDELVTKFANLLASPLDVAKIGVDWAIYSVEKYHIDDKLEWFYRELKDHGINVKPFSFFNFGNYGASVEVEFMRLTGVKKHVPNIDLDGWASWHNDLDEKYGGELSVSNLFGSSAFLKALVNYEKRPQEDFFGLGPDTSLGESATYEFKETKLGVGGGFEPTISTRIEFDAAFRRVSIDDGDDDGKIQLFQRFPSGSIAGDDDEDLLSFSVELMHDTRNYREDPTSGGYERFEIGYTEGVNGSEAAYTRYIVEAARYIRLFSDRRVLVAHVYGEHNDEINGQEIPFFDLARLGGPGVGPVRGQALRGFQFNRFYGESLALLNLEYRYNIWEYRKFKMDAFAFWDEGQVFNEFSEFQFKDFRESYGGGIRVGIMRKMLFVLGVGHSDEGTELFFNIDECFLREQEEIQV